MPCHSSIWKKTTNTWYLLKQNKKEASRQIIVKNNRAQETDRTENLDLKNLGKLAPKESLLTKRLVAIKEVPEDELNLDVQTNQNAINKDTQHNNLVAGENTRLKLVPEEEQRLETMGVPYITFDKFCEFLRVFNIKSPVDVKVKCVYLSSLLQNI